MKKYYQNDTLILLYEEVAAMQTYDHELIIHLKSGVQIGTNKDKADIIKGYTEYLAFDNR